MLRLAAVLLLAGCGDPEPESDVKILKLEVPETVAVSPQGGRTTIAVRSDAAWEVTSDAAWLTFSPAKAISTAK